MNDKETPEPEEPPKAKSLTQWEEACGGCGSIDETKRCLGCLHVGWPSTNGTFKPGKAP